MHETIKTEDHRQDAERPTFQMADEAVGMECLDQLFAKCEIADDRNQGEGRPVKGNLSGGNIGAGSFDTGLHHDEDDDGDYFQQNPAKGIQGIDGHLKLIEDQD
jgi:hypothetical protein